MIKKAIRFLSLALCAALLFGMLPGMTAFATEEETEAAVQETETATQEAEAVGETETTGETEEETTEATEETTEATEEPTEAPTEAPAEETFVETAELLNEDAGIMLMAASAPMSLEELQAKFPHGMYWNHYVSAEWETGDNLYANWNESFGDSVTWSPCASHNQSYTVGSYDCNFFDGGLQCCGFARKLGFDAYGTKVTSWYDGASIWEIKPGDVVHYKGLGADATNGHWVFVTAVSGTTLTLGECNIVGDLCGIRWGRTLDISGAYDITVYSAPWNLYENSGPQYEVDSRYVTPFRAYTFSSDPIKCYASIADGMNDDPYFPGYINSDHECVIQKVYTNGWCEVDIPWDGPDTGNKYMRISDFLGSDTLIAASFNTVYPVYQRSDLQTAWSTPIVMDRPIYKTGQYGERSQILYWTENEYYCGWLDHTITPPQSVTVSVVPGTSTTNTTFTWDVSSEVTMASIRIFKDAPWTGEDHSIHGITDRTVSQILPVGTYYAYVDALDSSDNGCYVTSSANPISFVVGQGVSYTVSFNANGGSDAPGEQIKLPDTALTLSSAVPVRDGYLFKGWATSANASTAAYQPGGSFTTNADTTLYAVWAKKSAGEGDPQIIVSKPIGIKGHQVDVTISLKNNPGIASMRLTVGYDKNLLKLIHVTDGGNLGTEIHSDNLNACPYTLSWANDLATENYSYNGEIVTLTFEVAENAQQVQSPVTVYYDYEDYDIFDVNGKRVEFFPVDGSVNITNVLIGDVNKDGKVNTLDRMTLTRYLAKWKGYTEDTIDMTAADVNCDGHVNTLDRMILTRHLGKWTWYEQLPYNG